MKWAIALFACVSLVAAASLNEQHHENVMDKAYLEKQKFLLEIVYRVMDPLMFEDYIKLGDKLMIEKSYYTHYDMYMEKFYEAYKMGVLLPKGEFFGALVKTHAMQAYGLFNYFYYAKDFETFMHNVCFARIHMNEGMFVYALTMAVIHRADCKGLMLPSIYEIMPQHFFNSKLVYEAEKFDYDTYNKMMMYEKEYKDVFYKNNKHFYGEYMYMKDFKTYQWYKLMGLMEHFYPEENFLLRENIYEYNHDEKWLTMMKSVKMFYMPVDYTRDVKIWNEDSKMSYFTEDLGLNSYFYYLNMDYNYMLDGKTFGLDKDRRGEYYMYNLRQILARYYMERLSNGLGEIPEFSFLYPIKQGYNPEMISYNGVGFSHRKNYYELQTYGNFAMLDKIVSFMKRVNDIVDLGYYVMNDGTKVDMRSPQAIEYIGNMMQGNVDSFDQMFFTYWYVYANMYFANVDFKDMEVYPNVMLNFETMLRDPMSYMFHKMIVDVYYRFMHYLPKYTKEELMFPGVEMKHVEVSNMVTYFDLVDTDISNLMNSKMIFHDGKFVMDKALFARQMRLNHKPYVFTYQIQSDKPQKVVIAAFMGPKYDEYGHMLTMSENRENFVEMDSFVYDLVAGVNEIKRSSNDVAYFAKDRTTYAELYYYVMMAMEGKYEFPLTMSQPHCKFPDRLVLPKGSAEGMPMQMFFMVMPYMQPQKPQYTGYNFSYDCGIGSGSRYLDARPFGYPLDRDIDEFGFYVPNMYFKDVKIYHEYTFDKYYMPNGYKTMGKFDYNFYNDYYTKYFHKN